jgi:hypothetical protein
MYGMSLSIYGYRELVEIMYVVKHDARVSDRLRSAVFEIAIAALPVRPQRYERGQEYAPPRHHQRRCAVAGCGTRDQSRDPLWPVQEKRCHEVRDGESGLQLKASMMLH